MKVRQDAWTDEDDLLLAETVLRHVREGSTQLNAFEEVGDRLNRTSAACGFRWNAVVRYSYEQALQLAKKHRKDKMRAASGEQAKKRLLYTPPASDSITDYEEFVQEESIVQYKEAIPYQETTVPAAKGPMTMQDVIYFLQTVGSSNIKVTALENENTRLKQEIKSQILRNEELEKKLEKLEKQSHTVQEDYETLMNIMNRARKLAVMDDEERSQTSFRMDRNGNLEKIAE
ncbi:MULTISPECIES: RsfA family transcriptional regulator [Bacillus]|uniref:RsfA family transcriptional regulator n=2 Tax=Bacillus cereus group TaxID=86661 RepID=A0A2A7D4S9_BACAN|nr:MULTISPECIES: RsfA family transcriptional regulator [Bacillus]MCP1166461.1 RsfA family transcriptional regulator [Bacillus sp. 1813sda1]MDC7974379.1 RsfA family transcriptional regulator [Bacillus sp. BLCC-B18]OTW69589.1 RsfA family transcriptional regulator [Bacillus thuringiensis serovar coreanensis]OTX45786.1 RsfA family transcriptional regulator [Bacillus thuringiensis serovar sooncheon]OTX48601.1 RsfA family transcriptional regulator [Bacillus thuringiensis serovar guiyangiensis]